MTSTPIFVAIDNGSQSTKVSAVDSHGYVLEFVQRALMPTVSSGRGRVVHPADDVWDSIRVACAELMSRLGDRTQQVVGVGLCTIRFCRAYLNDDGELVEPMLSWMDERVGHPVGELPFGTRFITTSSGYIAHRLTGVRRDASGNCQGMWPIDQATWKWSSEPSAFLNAGMFREQLFELVAPGELIGTVTKAAATATGLPSGLPVYATSNDKAVEALGSGLRSDDSILVSLGTYITSMTVSRTFAETTDGNWRNFGSVPGEYLYESGGIRRGMWTVSWFRNLLGDTTDGELNVGAEGVQPGSNGLYTILDWLAPSTAPYRRGALLGFDGSQGRFEIYRSILEGIAFTMKVHRGVLEKESGRTFTETIIAGGGSRSRLMMQIMADVLDVPTRRMAMPDGAGIGAAICAAVGSGVHSDWDSAVHAMVHVKDTFDPIPANVSAYRPISGAHAELNRFTDPLFRILADVAPEAS
ncbi:MAG: FGGY-family carbohydrate kinase [Lacisediminihabitans sp.]